MLGGLQRFRAWRPAAALSALLALALLVAAQSLGAYDALRERAFDVMLGRLAPLPDGANVVVVDIDRASLERLGPWPWSREQVAGLVSRVLSAKPAAVALDILVEGPDERSPAALARRLAELTGSEEARLIAAGLIDGDMQLAAALGGKPVVLGIALDPERGGELPASVPILVQGSVELDAIWQAPGIRGPPGAVAEAAAGLGVMAMAGDGDGRVRRVPLLTVAGQRLRPGLALEAARLGVGASAYVVTRDGTLRTGDLAVALPIDAALRLLPGSARLAGQRTIPAVDVGMSTAQAAMAGRVVLIGSSAPELGGLRLASGGELVPSVHLQAGAVAQVQAQIAPFRPMAIDLHEGLALLAAALAGLGAALRWPPLRGAAVAVGLALAWLVFTGAALRGWQVLIDPVGVPAAVLGSFAISAVLAAVETGRREAALRRRFEQHLAPELVERLAQDPGLLKLAGETRVASILFTDVEGFTAMTERSDPEALIGVLDRYIDEMSAVIVAHGGMVEKIVGDGFHALFNAPLDLPGHADKAVACALAIREFSERFAAEPRAKALGFGRTRVGVETGPVIVGDVGGGTRLDYTAYGNAMNTAARLEAANKELGSAVLIGPGTTAQMTDTSTLRPLGSLSIRGRSEPMAVCDVWPAAMSEEQRRRHLAAMRGAATDPQGAARELARLSRELPADAALTRLAERLQRPL